MRYRYPYIRNHKSIKQGYIDSSKEKHESPKFEDDLNPRNPRIRPGVRENVSILCILVSFPMFPFRFVKTGVIIIIVQESLHLTCFENVTYHKLCD